jgi:hypothetical protein
MDLLRAMQAQGGVAGTITGSLATQFANDFEAGMLEFFTTRNAEVSALLREMAAYFVGFEPGRGNYYRAIIDTARKANAEVVFATTNYDLLIEHSITQSGARITYHGRPVPRNNFSLLKIHGSCNFLPHLGGSSIRGLGFVVPEGTGGILDAPVRPAQTTEEVREFCSREDSIAPAIAVYMRGKPVLYCGPFVKEQQLAFAREVAAARKVFIVGLRCNPTDHHIWDVLARAKAWLGYVGLQPDGFSTWCKARRRKNASVVAPTFQDALPTILRALVAA